MANGTIDDKANEPTEAEKNFGIVAMVGSAVAGGAYTTYKAYEWLRTANTALTSALAAPVIGIGGAVASGIAGFLAYGIPYATYRALTAKKPEPEEEKPQLPPGHPGHRMAA